jgi:hypothetical protein
MNTGSVDITGTDKSEGELPVTFTGFCDDFEDMDNAPYEMVIFNKDAAGTGP